MITVAQQIANINGAIINLIHGSSTSLHTTHPHLIGYFNLIVSEIYDSPLVGEGCLDTYRHALTYLATPDCTMIPEQATLYLQPFSCPSLNGYYRTTEGESVVCTNLVQPLPHYCHSWNILAD